MDTVRILICAVHGNEAFDGQRALCRWNCSRFLEHGNSQARGRSACFVPVMQKMQNNRNFTLSSIFYVEPSLLSLTLRDLRSRFAPLHIPPRLRRGVAEHNKKNRVQASLTRFFIVFCGE